MILLRMLAMGATSLLACSQGTPPATTQLPVVWSHLEPAIGSDSPWDGYPGVAADRVLFETRTGVLAVDSHSGAVQWESTLWTPKSPTAFNIAVEGRLAFLNEADSVFAIELANGARAWATSLGASANYGHTLPVRDAVLTTTARPSVVALDAATGRPRWEVGLPLEWDSGGVFTGLAASGDTIYAAASEHLLRNGADKRGAILALDRESGRVLWRYTAADRHSSAGRRLTVAQHLILVADLYGNSVFAVDRFTAAETWRARGAPASFGPDDAPHVRGDTAFVGSNDRHVYALRATSGNVIWQRRVGGSIHAFALCGPYVLANSFALSVVPRDPNRAAFTMLSDEDSPIGFPTSGFAVVGDIATFATSRGRVAVRCI